MRFDGDAAGGSLSLDRAGGRPDASVAVATAEGRTTRYRVAFDDSDAQLWETTFPSGTVATALRRADASRETQRADGTQTSITSRGDPRFGMAVPYPSLMDVTAPGLERKRVQQEKASTTSPLSPLPFSLATQTETRTQNNKTTTMMFDALSGVRTVTSAEGRVRTSTIDDKGRVIEVAVDGLYPVHMAYDTFGRLERVEQGEDADLRVTQLGYAPDGMLASVQDAEGRVTSFVRDALGRVTATTLPGGRVVSTGYDDGGNVTAVTPPSRPSHTLDYTPVDLVQSTTAPEVDGEAAVTSFSYDRDRALVSIDNPTDDDVAFTLDSAGRVQDAAFSGDTVTRSYDPTTGQLVGISGPGGEALTFSYAGPYLNYAQWDGPVAGALYRNRNADHLPDFEVYASTVAVSFAYDRDLLLTTAGAVNLERRPDNGLVSRSFVNSATTTFGHNGFGERVSTVLDFGGTPLFEETLTRDKLGRITAKSETVDGDNVLLTYHYDAAGRLERVDQDGSEAQSFTWDDNGNRTSITTTNGTVDCATDARDRLIACGDVEYTFDADGSLVQKVDTANDATTRYAYDAMGNLRQVVLPDGRVIEYIVDGLNRRVGKSVDGVLTRQWLYGDQLRIVAELDGNGALRASFSYGTRSNAPDAAVINDVVYAIAHDPVGTPRLMVNANTGDIVRRLTVDAWGVVQNDTNPGFIPFGFAGGLYDEDTGLVRFGARDYDPETGRWTAKDPISFAGGDTNLYGYVLADPVNGIDPEGKNPILIGALIGALAGIGLGFSDDAQGANLVFPIAGAAIGATGGLALTLLDDGVCSGEIDGDCVSGCYNAYEDLVFMCLEQGQEPNHCATLFIPELTVCLAGCGYFPP